MTVLEDLFYYCKDIFRINIRKRNEYLSQMLSNNILYHPFSLLTLSAPLDKSLPGAYKTATEDQVELIDMQKILQIRTQKSFQDFTVTGTFLTLKNLNIYSLFDDHCMLYVLHLDYHQQ